MVTPEYAIERAKVEIPSRDKSGAWAYFVPLNKHSGFKYYTNAYHAETTHERQKIASENGFGPRLLSNIFNFLTPSNKLRWGYITERAILAWDRFLPVYCGRLGITVQQYNDTTFPYEKNWELWRAIERKLFSNDLAWLESQCKLHFPNYTDFDLHMGNFGYVKRKPVLIDFSHLG